MLNKPVIRKVLGVVMKKEFEIRGDELYLFILGTSPVLTVMGALFALPGIIAWLMGIWSVLFSHDPMLIADFFKLFFAGGLFVLLGSALASYRVSKSINKNATHIKNYSSVLGFQSAKTLPISKVSRLELSQEWRSSSSSNGGSSYLVYPIKIVTQIATHDLNDTTEFAVSRRQAEALARFLNISLQDSSSGQGFERKPSELDDKVIDSITERIEAPILPADSRIQVLKGQNNITLKLSARRGVVVSGLFRLLFLVPAFWFISEMLDGFSIDGKNWLIPVIVGIVFFLILLFNTIKHLSPLVSLPELTLTPQKITYRAIWYKKAVSMNCADIEEINSSDSQCIQIVSDHGKIDLWMYKSESDKDFVKSMLMYCLQFTKKN
ncbi:MAG: hypothetical protein ACI910_002917 [Oleispira sp.]|jgi:hypothetical protein